MEWLRLAVISGSLKVSPGTKSLLSPSVARSRAGLEYKTWILWADTRWDWKESSGKQLLEVVGDVVS